MASIPTYTAEQFAQAFLNLLPTGKAWPKETESNLTRTAAALVPVYVTNSHSAGNLLVDTFPSSTIELLPEWEASLGLPDECQGPAPTLQARRAQVVARFIDSGGQSLQHFIDIAAALGYPITITEYEPSRAGAMRAGQPLMAEGMQFVMRINAALLNIRHFTAGSSTAGEPLTSFGNDVLVCELTRIAPAHTRPVFSYT
ncbi:YmfQ family protein [Paracraurococcus lichenis]|uniref:DUF2313 domain-containing protein n=1 Tax=Paracraurococcus lichenis TaxID=3064888 RepID=A0ABT9E4G9_9PROT|nr:putative phage tail protein [Paracraurococcus sp. LOR1-02]MDO9711041.1 DUF2313 domain-containing protein [Paracraurococcus sp. LOR1-02]